MTVVSSKEFSAHQKEYFDLAVNGQICIKRGNDMFQLSSVNINDTEESISESQQPDHHLAEMLGCDPANTYAQRPIAVLEGDAAIEFYERWQKLLEMPKKPLSEEERKKRKEWKEFFRQQK